MSVMSRVEGAFCRSRPWSLAVEHVVLPQVAGTADWSGTVLEVGGGNGVMADRLLEQHAQIRKLILVDIDPAMVEAAGRRLAHHGERAEVVLTDGGPLPVPDGSVDVVCAWLMLHHVVDWPPLIADIRRVLRPGGRFVGYDLTAAPLGRMLHGFTRSECVLLRPGELRTELDALGFDGITIEPRAADQLMVFHATAGQDVRE